MESALIRRVHAGDEEALGLIYDAYSSVVYAIGLKVLRDCKRAEDLLQDTFLRLWREPDQFTARHSLEANLALYAYAGALRVAKQQKTPEVQEF